MNTTNESNGTAFAPGPILSWFLRGRARSLRRFVLNACAGSKHSPRVFLGTLAWIVSGAIISVVIWKWLGEPLNAFGAYFGAVPGLIVSLVLFWVLNLAWVQTLLPFPTCRQGKCSTIEDYEWPWPTIYGCIGWRTYVYHCRCGDQYVRRGKRFTQMLPGDEAIPFKKLTGFRTWSDDTDPLDLDQDYSG